MERSVETLKRLRIALIGLATVLLIGGAAHVAMQSASDEAPVTQDLAQDSQLQAADADLAAEQKPDDPLAEIGVTPAVEQTQGAIAGKTKSGQRAVP